MRAMFVQGVWYEIQSGWDRIMGCWKEKQKKEKVGASNHTKQNTWEKQISTTDAYLFCSLLKITKDRFLEDLRKLDSDTPLLFRMISMRATTGIYSQWLRAF